MAVLHALFVAPWPFWAAAIGIAAVSTALLLVEGRYLGVSSGYSAALGLPLARNAACGAGEGGARGEKVSGRAWFLLGLPLGGLLASLAGGPTLTATMGHLDVFAGSLPVEAALLLVGGVLIGWGTRQGGGCTSGHGIVGCALARPVSLVATGTFFLTGALAANLVRLLGGLR